MAQRLAFSRQFLVAQLGAAGQGRAAFDIPGLLASVLPKEVAMENHEAWKWVNYRLARWFAGAAGTRRLMAGGVQLDYFPSR